MIGEGRGDIIPTQRDREKSRVELLLSASARFCPLERRQRASTRDAPLINLSPSVSVIAQRVLECVDPRAAHASGSRGTVFCSSPVNLAEAVGEGIGT